MIEFTDADIFESDAECLVDPVNCHGVSGAGLAKGFAYHFPYAQQSYKHFCETGWMQLGRVAITDMCTTKTPFYIAWFPTKDYPWQKSKLKWIQDGLKSLRFNLERCKIESVSIPAIGCGLGALDWYEVLPEIVSEMDKSTVGRVVIHNPR